MKLTGLAIAALALGLATGTGAAAHAQYAPQQGYWQGQQNPYGDGDADDYGRNGDAGEYWKFQQRGYREGYRGAQKDFENHRNPTPFNRDEYRHPDDVPRAAMRTYRIAFRQGYLQAERQLESDPDGDGR